MKNIDSVEEWKKHCKFLMEYSFYGQNDEDSNKELLLGEEDGEIPVETNDENVEEVPVDDIPTPQPEVQNIQPENNVQVDVSDLVGKQDEATLKIDSLINNFNQLIANNQELEKRFSDITLKLDKIDNLEKEIIKRNPTTIEKMELRSLETYPNSASPSLVDFWNNEDNYDASDSLEKGKAELAKAVDDEEEDENQKQGEFQATAEEIDKEYDESEVKKSLGISPLRRY